MLKCSLRETKRNQDFCIDLFSVGGMMVIYCTENRHFELKDMFLVLALLSDTFYLTFGQLKKFRI